jgi:hypothetical protein
VAESTLDQIIEKLQKKKDFPKFFKMLQEFVAEVTEARKSLFDSSSRVTALCRVPLNENKLIVYRFLQDHSTDSKFVASAISLLESNSAIKAYLAKLDQQQISQNVAAEKTRQQGEAVLVSADEVLSRIRNIFDIIYPSTLSEAFAGVAFQQSTSRHDRTLNVEHSTPISPLHDIDHETINQLEEIIDQFKRKRKPELVRFLESAGTSAVATKISDILAEFSDYETRSIILLAKLKRSKRQKRHTKNSSDDFEDYF